MPNNKTEYSISNFSAVNNFIEEEEKYSKQFRKIQTARLFKRYSLYGSLVIISLAILTLCIGTVYWLKNNDLNYLIGGKTVVENYNLSNTDAKKILENLNEQQEDSFVYLNSITKKITIFFSKQLIFQDGTNTNIHVGWNFKLDNFEYPNYQYCYLDIPTEQGEWEDSLDLMYKNKKEEPKEHLKARDNLSVFDFNNAIGICRSLFKY